MRSGEANRHVVVTASMALATRGLFGPVGADDQIHAPGFLISPVGPPAGIIGVLEGCKDPGRFLRVCDALQPKPLTALVPRLGGAVRRRKPSTTFSRGTWPDVFVLKLPR